MKTCFLFLIFLLHNCLSLGPLSSERFNDISKNSEGSDRKDNTRGGGRVSTTPACDHLPFNASFVLFSFSTCRISYTSLAHTFRVYSLIFNRFFICLPNTKYFMLCQIFVCLSLFARVFYLICQLFSSVSRRIFSILFHSFLRFFIHLVANISFIPFFQCWLHSWLWLDIYEKCTVRTSRTSPLN